MSVRKLKPVVVCITLFLLILCNYCNYKSLHFHVLGNGYLVVHSHPVDKNPNNSSPMQQTHQHSRFEFLLLNFLSIVEFVVILLGIIIIFEKLTFYFKKFEQNNIYATPFYAFPVLRGPPSC